MGLSQDATNRSTWSKASARRSLDAVTGFIDPGELAAYGHIRDEAQGRAILDIGVGTGRTIPFLRPLTPDYRALDCLPAMVDLCRRRFPTARVDLGDARTLSGYASDSFGLVCFSYNGLDAVSHADRWRALRSVRRVLAARGLFFFSTLNLNGPTFRERPWRLRVWPTKNPLRYAWRAGAQIVSSPVDMLGWLRLRAHEERGDGYAVAPLSAHHYGVLAHYTTLERQLDELERAGFDSDPVVFESREGRRIGRRDDTSRSDWFHIIARRRDDDTAIDLEPTSSRSARYCGSVST